jgi:hypothetical protein
MTHRPASTAIVALLSTLVAAGLLVSVVAGDAAAAVFFGSYGSVGAYLAARRPASAIGWLLLLTGLGLAMGSVVIRSPLPDLRAGTIDGVAGARAWLNALGWSVALTGFTGLALTFPEGHPPRARWGMVARLTFVASVVVGVLIALYPTINVTVADAPSGVDVPNPYALAPDHPLWRVIPSSGDALYPALFGLFLVGTASLATRAWAATGIVRLQYRWFVAGTAVVVVALTIWAVATFILLVPGTGPTLTLVVLASPAVPLAVAVAVLRYRLYAIDRLISRSVSWGLVTGVLVTVFGALVIALQSLLADVTQGGTLAVAISTLVAFAIFQPVRVRVQTAVDRRFDRARYDQRLTVESFSGRIRDEVDLATLRHDLLTTTDDAVRPTAAAVWLRPSPGP